MDEMVSQGHLVLVFRLVQGLIEHDDEGGLGIQRVKVGLHLNWDLVSELLSLDDSEDFSPISLQDGLVDGNDFFLVENLLLQSISVLFDHNFVKVLLHLVELLVLDISPYIFGTWFG